MNGTKTKRTAAACLTALAMIALIAFAAFSSQASAWGDRDIRINANGQSYGTTYLDEEGNVQLADLTRVEATNGLIGYVSPKEMDAACWEGASTPEEQTAFAEALGQSCIKAYMEAVNRYYGVDIIGYDDALACVQAMRSSGGFDECYRILSQLVETKTNGNETLSSDAFETIYHTAQQQVSVAIPVYESDGITVIGEYVVNRM